MELTTALNVPHCPRFGRQIQVPYGDRRKSGLEGTFMMIARATWITRLAAPVRGLGPYAAIELILPGGSLIALSLWAIRHRAWVTTRVRHALSRLSGLRPLARARDQVALSVPRSYIRAPHRSRSAPKLASTLLSCD